MSVGTVYSHFGSLSELMQSLWRRPARKLVQRLAQLGDELSDPLEQLRSYLEAYVQFSIAEPEVFRAAFLYVRPESVAAPEKIALEDDEFFSLFRRAIVQGQNEGRFRSGDPDTLVQLVLGSIHGALALPVNLHRLALRDGVDVAEEAIAAQLEWLQQAV